MIRVFLIIGIIFLAYALVFIGALESPIDQPRFHMKTPVPVDADTSKCEPGQYGGRVLIGALVDPKTFNPIVDNETSSRDINERLYAALVSRNNITQEIVPSLAYA